MQTAALRPHRTALFSILFCAAVALAPSLSRAQTLGPPPAPKPTDPMGLSTGKTSVSGAKNLAGRFGLGVARLGPQESPALSVDWQMSSASSLQINLSMDHTKNDNTFIIDGLFSRNLFVEQFMHFFLYGGAGLLSEKVNGSNKSGLLAEGGVGGRLFFIGFPYLGFSLRGSVQLRTIDGTRFGTRASMGAHYYF